MIDLREEGFCRTCFLPFEVNLGASGAETRVSVRRGGKAKMIVSPSTLGAHDLPPFIVPLPRREFQPPSLPPVGRFDRFRPLGIICPSRFSIEDVPGKEKKSGKSPKEERR
jgi:hypothetical protein